MLGAIELGPSSANLNDRDRSPGWNPAYEGVFLVPWFADGTSAHDSAPPSVGELTADAGAYVRHRSLAERVGQLILIIRRQRFP